MNKVKRAKSSLEKKPKEKKMKEKKYKSINVAIRDYKHFCKGDIVAIVEHTIVDAPIDSEKYNKLAIYVRADIFKKENGKLVRYNGFEQHHNTTEFAGFMRSTEKLSAKDEKEFYKQEKVFQNVIKES